MSRVTWLSVSILLLSIYSTGLSCLWFVVSIVQPRWGRAISSSGGMAPSTASTLATLFAKTIEMSFVTVFISFLGQVLTRRSFIKKSRGMTLAEMTMRNWVIVRNVYFFFFCFFESHAPYSYMYELTSFRD